MGLAGIEAIRFASVRHPIGRRSRLFRALRVDHVIDVGANTGQFGSELRASGFEGKILSFEPMAEAYSELRRRVGRDQGWSTVRCALGQSEGVLTLNISGHSASSSLLGMLPLHEDAAPGTRYVGKEVVTVRRLDSLLAEHLPINSRPYLKIDVQGYEMEVLRGAGARLEEFVAIQLELSLVRLYADAPLAQEVDRFVSDAGYQLAGVEPGFADPVSGRLLQMDGIYVRSDVLGELPGGAR
jgi:methyltransferase, FkbM family